MKAKSILAFFLSIIILSAFVSAGVQEEAQTQEKARRMTRENITHAGPIESQRSSLN